MTQFTIVLIIHIVMCILALRQIWHAQNEDGIGWQVAWSFIVLLTPLVGPVMYFGMAMPPPEKSKKDRMGGFGIMGNFTGLYEGSADAKPPPVPPPPPPPKKPPPDDGGDGRMGLGAEKSKSSTQSDLAREMEEARRLEQQEMDRQRQRDQ